jgi:Cytochrome C'
MQQRIRMVCGIIGVSFGILGLVALGHAYADDDEIVVPKKIQETVNKMADNVGKGNKVDKDATMFFMDHKEELKKTMWVFKQREKDGKGGLGVGPKPGAYKPDGIEALIFNQLAMKPMQQLDAKTSAADLNRLADITLAMVEITGKFAPEKPVGKKTPKEWNGSNEDVKKAALLLKDAVKAGSNADMKTALGQIAAGCTRCHNTFREN